jgi:hypothetical protein
MDTVYLVCALVGATLLVAQFLLGLLGIGGDHGVDADHDVDVDHDAGDAHHDTSADHDHGHSWYVGILTFRTVVAALTFFGLAGLAASQQFQEEEHISLGVAIAAGVGAMLLVAWMMKSLKKLASEGTVRIDRAVGQPGTVYLSIPGRRSGVGKVTVVLQNRTVEYQAVTAEEELPTGAKVQVVAVIGADTVEVAPATAPERTANV